MESEHGSKSSQRPRPEDENVMVGELQPFIPFDNVEIVDERRSSTESTSEDRGCSVTSVDTYSISSDSNSDDFIQVDPALVVKTDDHATRVTEDDVSSKACFKLEEYLRSSSSISRISDVTIESFIPDVSPTQSPPIQVMERRDDYDPNRIPASIFEKPSSPMDWSAASNESLFSIQIENYSFSRDHIFILGGDLDNTKEFSGPEDCYSFRELYSGELIGPDNNHCKPKELKAASELVKLKENALSKDTQQLPQKASVLEEALPKIPEKCISNNFNIKVESLQNEIANRTQGASIQSFTHSREQQRCSCKWLSCPTGSCASCSGFSCQSCCNCSTCASCCCTDCCSTCTIRRNFNCFSFQSSRNVQSRSRRDSRKRCRCCSCC